MIDLLVDMSNAIMKRPVAANFANRFLGEFAVMDLFAVITQQTSPTDSWGEDQTSLFEGWEELHPFFFSACSLPFFSRGKGDRQDLFPLPREKGGLVLPTEG